MKFILMVVAAVLTLPDSAFASLIINGGFESPTPSGLFSPPYNEPPNYTYPANGGPPVTLDSWTYAGGSGLINTVNSPNAWYGNTPPSGYGGVQFAFVQSTGSVSQTFSAPTGLATLQWLQGSRPDFGAFNGNETYQVVLNGNVIGTYTTTSGENFSLETISGVNLLASNTLTFEGLARTDSTVFLDAVAVTSVPEPTTWAMLILGFVAMAFLRWNTGMKQLPLA
jgi:hypothetical protein